MRKRKQGESVTFLAFFFIFDYKNKNYLKFSIDKQRKNMLL